MDNPNSKFLETMYIRNYTAMASYAQRFFKNKDIAQDVVQETFLIAQIKIDQLISSPSPRGWLFNTLKNVIGNTYKRQKRLDALKKQIKQDTSVPMEVSVKAQYQGAISDEDLQILIWIYCDGQPYADVAERLGISLAACKKRIQRAKSRLKDAIEEKI